MARSFVRLAAVVVLGVVAVLSIARAALAAPASPQEVADACVAEMQSLAAAASSTIQDEFTGFLDALETTPAGSPASPVFKAAAAFAARQEKTVGSARAKILRTSERCLARLERLDANSVQLMSVEFYSDLTRQNLREELISMQSDTAEAVLQILTL